jgi:tRNA(adenine34) deaminase
VDHALIESMMRRALDLAWRAAECGEVPVGAVVFRDDRVLGQGYNLRETLHDPTAHAEIVALREAALRLDNWRLDGCAMAVTLEPCPMCAGALVNARMATLIYGAADPKMGCVDTLHALCTEPRFNHRLHVERGVMAEACADVLRRFFARRRGAVKPPKPGR